jgi:PPE-repeat protein
VYGLSHSIINIKEVNVLYSENYTIPSVKLTKIDHTSTSLSTFFIGFGSKRFLDNNIFINKMIQFNLPFNFYTPNNQYEIKPTLRSDLENNIVKFAFSRQNTLNFSVGIGAAF